jgi:hypothetical protein
MSKSSLENNIQFANIFQIALEKKTENKSKLQLKPLKRKTINTKKEIITDDIEIPDFLTINAFSDDVKEFESGFAKSIFSM